MGSSGEDRQVGNKRRAGSKSLRDFVGRRNTGDGKLVASSILLVLVRRRLDVV